jgi:hypothetical protein
MGWALGFTEREYTDRELGLRIRGNLVKTYFIPWGTPRWRHPVVEPVIVGHLNDSIPESVSINYCEHLIDFSTYKSLFCEHRIRFQWKRLQ